MAVGSLPGSMEWHSPPAAIVRRGTAAQDAWHFAAIAVVDGTGRLTHALGDPEVLTFPRSAIKPFQALPLLSTGAADALGLDSEELALTAASHDGSDVHRAVAARLLAKAGASAAELQCGAHWPIGMRAAERYPAHGEERDPLRHNCSGKHAGWLALARALGTPPAAYLEPAGAVQQVVRAAVAAACEVDPDTMTAATDGCSAPAYAFPLAALARGAMKLATRGPAGGSLDGALARIRTAMQAHPGLVSGPTRFDNQLAAAFGTRVVAKGGAEAVQALGWADPPLGIAVKILDGSERALAPVCLETMRQLGLWSGTPPAPLAERVRPVVRNHRGTETGVIEAAFSLVSALVSV